MEEEGMAEEGLVEVAKEGGGKVAAGWAAVEMAVAAKVAAVMVGVEQEEEA